MSDTMLLAEVERLTRHVALVSERVRQLSDEGDYAWGEVEKQRADNERLRDVLQRVSVRPSGDSTVQISFFSEGCTVTYPVRPQTTWALETLIEFDKVRRNALEAKP